MHLRSILPSLLAFLALAAPLPATSASLTELLHELGGKTSLPCLETATAAKVPPARPVGRCAADTVARLYLSLLRDRARLGVVREGLAYHEQMLETMQSWLEGGGGSKLMVDMLQVEVRRWQLRELEVTRSVRRAELFFTAVLGRDPATFDAPQPAKSAWPADEAAALAALAARRELPADEHADAEAALRRAWADHQSVQREITLLEPMKSFAADVHVATEQNFQVAQMTLRGLLEHARGSFELEEAYFDAESRRLLAEVRVLELLGRREALE